MSAASVLFKLSGDDSTASSDDELSGSSSSCDIAISCHVNKRHRVATLEEQQESVQSALSAAAQCVHPPAPLDRGQLLAFWDSVADVISDSVSTISETTAAQASVPKESVPTTSAANCIRICLAEEESSSSEHAAAAHEIANDSESSSGVVVLL